MYYFVPRTALNLLSIKLWIAAAVDFIDESRVVLLLNLVDVLRSL